MEKTIKQVQVVLDLIRGITLQSYPGFPRHSHYADEGKELPAEGHRQLPCIGRRKLEGWTREK